MSKADINKLLDEYRRRKKIREDRAESHIASQRDFKSLESWKKKYTTRHTVRYHTRMQKIINILNQSFSRKMKKKQYWSRKLKRRTILKNRQIRSIGGKYIDRLDPKNKKKNVNNPNRPRISKKDKGIFAVRLVYNFRQTDKPIIFHSKKAAYEAYNEKVIENKKNVWCPKIYKKRRKRDAEAPIYEIMLTRTDTTITSDTENIRGFRDKNGKFEYIRFEKDTVIVLEKSDWLVEDDFWVYGFHPKFDRKSAKWIGEHVLGQGLDKLNPKRVFCFNKYLIIDNTLDFDFVVCRNEKECIRLYGVLFKKYEKRKYLYFTGDLNPYFHEDWTEKIKEKCGWPQLF